MVRGGPQCMPLGPCHQVTLHIPRPPSRTVESLASEYVSEPLRSDATGTCGEPQRACGWKNTMLKFFYLFKIKIPFDEHAWCQDMTPSMPSFVQEPGAP